jgi:hypothetical protein
MVFAPVNKAFTECGEMIKTTDMVDWNREIDGHEMKTLDRMI